MLVHLGEGEFFNLGLVKTINFNKSDPDKDFYYKEEEDDKEYKTNFGFAHYIWTDGTHRTLSPEHSQKVFECIGRRDNEAISRHQMIIAARKILEELHQEDIKRGFEDDIADVRSLLDEMKGMFNKLRKER